MSVVTKRLFIVTPGANRLRCTVAYSRARWKAACGTGSSVQQVADDLGYESAGSFVAMFRKAFGTSPGRYAAQLHIQRACGASRNFIRSLPLDPGISNLLMFPIQCPLDASLAC